MRGIAILWIAFFHSFITYDSDRYPWPMSLQRLPGFVEQCSSGSIWSTFGCTIKAFTVALLERGPHAVGVFIILSGFGLALALAKTAGPRDGWMQWYRKRFLRLFPMYWLAHLVCLVSPFMDRKDPVDYRFLLSLLGDRVYPIDRMFYYFNPSWWFIGMLIEFCLVFPVLYRLLQRLGPARFLILCGFTTLLSRYLLNEVLHAHGNYLQGGFFVTRLWEFGAGMVLALLCHQRPDRLEKHLFSGRVLGGGILLYALGVYCYQPTITYIASDALLGTGLFVLMAHLALWIGRVPYLRAAIATAGIYSYGIFLLHQPYVMTVGGRLAPLGLAAYLVLMTCTIGCVALGAGVLEKRMNRLIGQWTAGKPKPAVSSTPAG